MLEVGMKIQTPSLLLRIDDMRSTWVRFEYWDTSKQEWKLRGYTEKKTVVEQKLESGDWIEVEE